jgi:hypothetical protein
MDAVVVITWQYAFFPIDATKQESGGRVTEFSL